MKILDGQKLASLIEEEIKEKISTLKRPPGLAFLLAGEDPASLTYIKRKQKKCEEVGITSFDTRYPQDISEETLLADITLLNKKPEVDGILVQLPLPPQIQTEKVLLAISPEKDVDGFHPINMGKLLLGQEDGFIPCTPAGIQRLLCHYNISIEGKHVVIVGRSNIVGKPLAALLVQNQPSANATVTIAHSKSHDLKALCQSADILIAAVGKPALITKEMVKAETVVIDVGINKLEGTLVGDVAFDEVAPISSAISPVPGGIGPMTIAMLLSNTLLSYSRRHL